MGWGVALGKLLGHSQLMLLFFQGKGPVACTALIWAERFFLTRPFRLQQDSLCLLLKCNRWVLGLNENVSST